MNTAVEIFQFPESGQQVRMVPIDGEPWFVGKDICEQLGIAKPRDAIAQLDEDERASTAVDTPGGRQTMSVVNEPGLFALMLISRSPKVKPFRRWVTHEVLPAIRKTGKYESAPRVMSIAPPPTTLEERAIILKHLAVFSHPDWVTAEAKMLWAQANGTMPEIEPERHTLYVEDYLAERGLTATAARKTAIQFGKQLAAQYRIARGTEPIKGDRDIAGRITKVNTYVEADRPLFDAVWTEFYAKPAVTR